MLKAKGFGCGPDLIAIEQGNWRDFKYSTLSVRLLCKSCHVWVCLYCTVTGHLVHPWHFVHPDIWSTWTFGLKTTRTPWHIVPRQLVYPDILSKDNSYTLTFHTPYFVMSWLKYQRVYQMSWTFRTPFPYSFLTERVYQMSWTFGTPFLYSLLAPDIWYTLTFGTPGYLVHPDIWYTRTFGTPSHLIHPRLG